MKIKNAILSSAIVFLTILAQVVFADVRGPPTFGIALIYLFILGIPIYFLLIGNGLIAFLIARASFAKEYLQKFDYKKIVVSLLAFSLIQIAIGPFMLVAFFDVGLLPWNVATVLAPYLANFIIGLFLNFAFSKWYFNLSNKEGLFLSLWASLFLNFWLALLELLLILSFFRSSL